MDYKSLWKKSSASNALRFLAGLEVLDEPDEETQSIAKEGDEKVECQIEKTEYQD